MFMTSQFLKVLKQDTRANHKKTDKLDFIN